jgi:predicted permease
MSIWHALRERLALLHRDERDRELDEEIRFHIDVETSRHEAVGLSSADARRRAIERFGDPTAIAVATRDARGNQPLEGTMQDVRYALRALSRNPGFTTLALLTLALGTGATVASFAVLDTVLLRPLPYREADRLVYLREISVQRAVSPPSHPNFIDWRDRARSFEGVASAMFPYPVTARATPGNGDPERVTVMGVSRGFFKVLGAPPIVGREFTDEENTFGGAGVAIVSYEYWQNTMGGRSELGVIAVSEQPKIVVGVLPPRFQFMMAAGIYVPHEQGPGTCRTCRNYMVVGRLNEGTTIDAARAEMRTLSSALVSEYGTDTNAADVDVQPLLEYIVGGYRTLLSVVFAAATLVLLIAITNLLSAQLSRAWAREREVMVRAALGASRSRLVRQLTVESGILVVVGTAVGLLLAQALTKLVRIVGTGLVPRLADVTIDARVALVAAGIMIVVTIAVGVYPALRMSRGAGAFAARGVRGSSVSVKLSAWRMLLGFEIALAVALSVGAALLVRTFQNIITSDTGFASRGIVTAAVTPTEADAARLNVALTELASLPGAEGAPYTTRLPLSWGANSGPVRRRSDPAGPNWPAMAGFRLVSPDYFTVLRQPVLRGRSFTAADRDGGEQVAIITPGIAEKLWPGEDPIGKTIGTNYLMDEWLTVVGMVAEASSWTMERGAQNEIFVPIEQHAHALPGQGQVVAVVRTTVKASTMTNAVRTSLRQSLPNSPATVGTMEERIARSAADRRFAMVALTTFAAIALFLAAIGLYGVIWYVVTTRVPEIGVRMALGATPGSVLGGVLGGALSVAVAGIVIGALGAMAGAKFLGSTLYGVSSQDPLAYVVSAGVVLLAVLLGAWGPARRASRVDPMVAMRSDS